MSEYFLYPIFTMIAGVIGLAVAVSMILVPRALAQLDKKLDTHVSTDKLEKVLNGRMNLTQALMKHPRIYGAILLVVSFLLVLSSLHI